ncbi:MAG: type II toxin-antitoxin system RelE/ParE family toxin [Planctomycetota bacterium]
MVQIDWSLPALNDLREVFRYIARDSRKYARATLERITAATARLSQSPLMGEILFEFPVYRQFVVGNYRLIYREDEANQRVLIIGVIHAGRDLPPILESRNA